MIRSSATSAAPRRLLAALAATGAAAAASLAFTAGAQADFTTAQCQGDAVTGTGASFQTNAHNNVFKPKLADPYCVQAGNTPAITWGAGGSGLGRREMGARTGNNTDGSNSRNRLARFTGSDEPLDSTNKAQIEQGTDAAGDEGTIHQIPLAVGAVTPIVNFPDNCDLNAANGIPTLNQTAPGATDGTNRVRFTKAQFEQIMWGSTSGGDQALFWKDIFPNIKPSTGHTQAECDAAQLIRVVRFDDSGSTFALKDALRKFNPSRQTGGVSSWNQFISPDTTLWPNAAKDSGAYCTSIGQAAAGASTVGAVPTGGTKPSLLTSCVGNGSSLANLLKTTDGGIGYVDLATAVAAGLRVTPAAGTVADKYFTQLANGSGEDAAAFKEATNLPGGYQSTNANGTGGANCQQTQFTGIPASTLGDWSQASGTNSAIGWGICTLTYALAWDDYARVYPNSADGQPAEERKARTVKDYLTAATTVGQGGLTSGDYAPLPDGTNGTLDIKSRAQAGAAAIGWNKTGTAGGGGGGGVVVTPPGGGGSASGGGSIPSVAKPSNVFSVPRTSLSSKTGSATLSIRLPGAGKLVLDPSATVKVSKNKKLKLGRITKTVSKAGLVKITIKPKGSVLKALKKAGKLKVSLKLTYTPKGGTPRSSSKTITLRYVKPAKKKG